MTAVKKQRDFTTGPLFMPALLFTVPIILSGLLQIFYNMADQIVVGQFSGDPNALAAVGSTSSITTLLANFSIGISIGAGVVVAQHFGAARREKLSEAVHTSMALALLLGVFFALVAFLLSRPLLVLMGTQPIILDTAALYIKIYFLGFPATMVYNFGATILRSVGNSRLPLYILAAAGVVNVALNLVFVIAFDMSVLGVAWATTISQYLAAVAVTVALMRTKGDHRFFVRKLRFHRSSLGNILRIGVPSGIQGCCFALANVFIQSAVNSFPAVTLPSGEVITDVVTGRTIAASIENFVYVAFHSFLQTTLTFVGQNYGAGKQDRVKRSLYVNLFWVTVVGVSVGLLLLAFFRPLCALYIDTSLPGTELVLAKARESGVVMLSTYFLCGIMEVFSGYLRGQGCSLMPMISSLFGACVFRILWVELVFPIPFFHSLSGIVLSWPASWVLVIGFHLLTIYFVKRKSRQKGASLS
ncbi:MAG: MATE family efflux transporter [Clostridia bacterium]|nr:MATE family efflux transporter [Clostridia bacterium]